MGYELMGRLHAGFVNALRAQRGQGTVEYVGLMLLIAVVIGGIWRASKNFHSDSSIAQTLTGEIKNAIGEVRKDK